MERGGGEVRAAAYLSFDELAAQVPWTRHGLRNLIRKGFLKRGVHWFQPAGPKSHTLFKWAAIVEFIEGGGAEGIAEAAPDPQDVQDEVRRRLSHILA